METQGQGGSVPGTAQLDAMLAAMLAQAGRRGCASREHAEAVKILRALGRHGDAAALLTGLTDMRAGRPEDHEAIGFAAFDAGLHNLSRDFYDRVVEAAPGDALAWYNLATGERNLGRLEEAERACDRALALAPEMAQAALLRSHLRTQTAARNHIDELKAMLSRGPVPGVGVFLHFALGKELDDLGDHDAAFDQFARGSAMRRQMLAYDVRQDVAKIERIVESFGATRLAAAPALAAPAYGFIVGLPRSGTTMTERILTGHGLVTSNGETDNLFGALAEGAAATGSDVFERVADADSRRVMPAYERRAGVPPEGGVILEKLPFNYLYAGAVRLTMPYARTLLVRRAPADNCFAMFSTLFGSGYPFSYSLEDLVIYYAAYRKLVAHWREAIGEQLYEVVYEEIVSDPVREGRRIADHFGIAWDDAMARIEANKSASATASAAQVRRPIYRTAQGRWRNYAKQLRPLTDGLEAAGIDPEDP